MAYSDNYHKLLEESGARLIISYGRRHGNYLEPTLPETFPGYLIDSGGFQLAMGTSERGIFLEGYCLYLKFLLRKYGEKIHGYFALDTKSPVQTLENLDYMLAQGLHPISIWKGYWEPQMLDDLCKNFEYVGVGGIARTSKQQLLSVWERIADKYPKTKIHLLGVGIRSTYAFRTFRPYSVDVSTWSVPGRFGHDIVMDDKGIMKEKKLSDEGRQRLRDDEEHEMEMIRGAIKTILSLETIMEDLHEPFQQQLDLRGLNDS